MQVGEIVFEERFHGPPASANGGYAAGRLAAFVDADTVEVRLAAPPPLNRPLAVMAGGDGVVELRDGDALVAIARPGELDLDIPQPVAPWEAVAAARRTPMRAELHPFPTCFGCGPLREAGDALRHICGPVEGREGVMACPMTTDASLPLDADRALAPEVIWAALDCPSAAATVPVGSPPHVLGTFTARIDRSVRAGEPHVVMSWGLGADGRKRYGASAVLDAAGGLCAAAAAVWIELRG